MTTLLPPPRPLRACLRGAEFLVTLETSGVLRFPATLTPRLTAATDAQRSNLELLPLTLHWPELDEDISIESLIELGYLH